MGKGDTMAIAVARFVMERAVNASVSSTLHSMNSSMKDTDNNQQSTSQLIGALKFAASKSIRTSTIILAAFNVLAAFITAFSILYDCYFASKRCNPKFKASKFCIKSIHPAETFPLVLAVGIVVQGLAFAGVQGEGLQSSNTTGCSLIAQFMWPALFIVPYIQVVFGLECAIRSMRKLPFQARGKYDVTICSGAIVVMLIATWIPSHIDPQPDFCFASLVWFISSFGEYALILLSISAGLMVLSALIIFIRLSTVNLIDQHQRITASRMVYYLVLGVVSLAFVIPFFVTTTVGKGDLKAGMMATVVLNLSGLMSGLVHLFLRSNTATTSFGPKNGRSWARGKHEIRMWGPNELAFTQQLADPVSGPRTPAELEGRAESRDGLISRLEKGRVISMESLRSPPLRSPPRYMNAAPMSELPIVEPTKRAHCHKQSYTLFPSEATTPVKPTPIREDPTSMYSTQGLSVYDYGRLEPPPPIHFGLKGHRRDSSIASSATVQIGLRISHALSPSQENILALPLPSTTYNANPMRPTPRPASPLRSAPPITQLSPILSIPQRPETSEVRLPLRSPKRPSPLNTDIRSPQQSPTSGDCANKSLPPTPKFSSSSIIPEMSKLQKMKGEEETQLSPAVYSPEKKSGRIEMPQSATVAKRNPLLDEGVARSNSSGRIGGSREGKTDWI